MSTLQYELMLALDSSVVIETLQHPMLGKKITRLFLGNHVRIVLQDVVLNEAQNILHMPREIILQKVRGIFGKEIYVFTTTDQMRLAAEKLEKQYGICHFPDSIILAAAKTNYWTLISLDRNLIRTAEFEGILAFNPRKGVF